MPDHTPETSTPSAAPTGAPSRRFRPLLLGAIALAALAIGLGIKYGVKAYTASVEGGIDAPKEFERLRQQRAAAPPEPAEPEPAPAGATGGTGATGTTAPTGPTGPTSPTG